MKPRMLLFIFGVGTLLLFNNCQDGGLKIADPVVTSSIDESTVILDVVASPSATVATSTSVSFTTSGGVSPYTYSLSFGSGTLSGNVYNAPNANETATILVTDSAGATGTIFVTVGTGSPITSSSSFTAGTVSYTSTIAALTALNSGCTTSDPNSAACQTAIYTYCASAGFATGYGPTGSDGTNSTLTCLSSASAGNFSVAFTTLQAYVSTCTSTNTVALECHAAVSRYCQAAGYATGTGIIAYSSTAATISCVNSTDAVVIATSFSTLAVYNSGCNSADTIACSSGAQLLCQAQGYAGGFGPVEASGAAATIYCVH